MAWTDPQTWTPGTTLTAANLNTYVRDNLDWLYDNLPIRATLWHGDSNVETGNVIVSVAESNQRFNGYAHQHVGANSDVFTQSFVLGEGTYTFVVLGVKTSGSGLLDWDIDGTTIETGQDWYNGAPQYNQEQSVANVVIDVGEGGRHVLTGTVNGKNGASSGYDIRLTKMWFVPASD
jgi:hypothetical protein